jgi:hypothetical protein
MSFQSNYPIAFNSVSMVTATLGANDPELGTRLSTGGLEYVFVFNAGGEDIDPGLGAVLNSAATGMSVTVSSATSADIVVGVCRHATLPTDTYGWLVTRGVTPIEMGATSGTVAALGLVEIAANGVFVPVSNTTGNKATPLGKALAEIVSNASGNAYISCY